MNTVLLHPMLVHFPIALLTAGFAVDVVGMFTKKEFCFSKAGFILIAMGFLGAVAAFLTGFFLTGELEGDAGIARERHELFAIMTLIAVTITLAVRSYLLIKQKEDSKLKYLTLTMTVVTVGFVLYTGFLGGGLVWDFMIGI